MKPSPLFEPGTIHGLTLSNRFVRSATWEGMATSTGDVTPLLTDTLVRLAKGGVGLVIPGHTYVSPEGKASAWQLAIDTDDRVEGLKTLTQAIHDADGKVVVQLTHAGHFAHESATKKPPWVVSAFEGLAQTPRLEMSAAMIQSLVQAFTDAARRARTAGFDGIQLHSGHGYLLSQFLSPWYNRRTDDYGGPIDRRVRIHTEIIRAIRKTVGDDYPLLVKMNSEDCIENGLTVDDSIQAAQKMVEAGLDAIELSGGTLTSGKLSPGRPGINTPEKEAYFRKAGQAFKQVLSVPLILVGGIRSMAVAEACLAEKAADFISLSRPLIREPDLIQRWQSGDLRPARCVSDNLCFRTGGTGDGIYCLTEEREAQKTEA